MLKVLKTESFISQLFIYREENMDRNLSELEESYILIHSLRDANLPKFLAEDVPLFERILDDLFPGIIPPEPDHGVLEVS